VDYGKVIIYIFIIYESCRCSFITKNSITCVDQFVSIPIFQFLIQFHNLFFLHGNKDNFQGLKLYVTMTNVDLPKSFNIISVDLDLMLFFYYLDSMLFF